MGEIRHFVQYWLKIMKEGSVNVQRLLQYLCYYIYIYKRWGVSLLRQMICVLIF